jgi:hypothetical protein
MTNTILKPLAMFFSVCAASFLVSNILFAHCDTMDGPVVIAAQKALASGDVSLVLIWVQKKDEAEIKEAFQKTLAVRKLGTEARNLADMYFFETLVRIHRAGEGVAYTGLKAAGAEVEPGIEAADKALASSSAEELTKHLSEAMRQAIHKQFTEAIARKNFKTDDIEAGREYVKRYVEFIHFVERVHQVLQQPAEGHSHEAH